MQLLLLGVPDLTGPDSSSVETVLSQPKRLGLLAYLAAARPYGFQRRDSLLALFWPDLAPAPARRALRQALHFLRRALGPDALMTRGADEIAVSATALSCDIRSFDRAVAAGNFCEALALYRGELLDGVYVSGASHRLDQWLDRERAYVLERALFAAWALADEEEKRGNVSGAAHWARRAAELHATNEHSIQRLIALLGRNGDRAGAVRAYEAFARRLSTQYDVQPAAQTMALIHSLRERR